MSNIYFIIGFTPNTQTRLNSPSSSLASRIQTKEKRQQTHSFLSSSSSHQYLSLDATSQPDRAILHAPSLEALTSGKGSRLAPIWLATTSPPSPESTTLALVAGIPTGPFQVVVLPAPAVRLRPAGLLALSSLHPDGTPLLPQRVLALPPVVAAAALLVHSEKGRDGGMKGQIAVVLLLLLRSKSTTALPPSLLKGRSMNQMAKSLRMANQMAKILTGLTNTCPGSSRLWQMLFFFFFETFSARARAALSCCRPWAGEFEFAAPPLELELDDE